MLGDGDECVWICASRSPDGGAFPLQLRTLTTGAVLAALAFSHGTRAQTAEDKPLFEIGVLGAGATLPDYPASAQNHLHAIALPYLIYRGEFLQLSANSIRGILFKSDRVNLDVSASGALSSHDDDARKFMPGLDDMAQIGPRLNILVARDDMGGKLDFELLLRAVLSTDFKSVAYRGLDFAPEFSYAQADFLGSGGS